MIFSWLKERRRRQWLARPFPSEWDDILERNLVRETRLAPHHRQKLRRDTLVFVAEKNWVGCGGLDLSDEIKVTIAAQACWMLLGIEEGYCFDGVKTVLVYPSAYAHPTERPARDMMVQENMPIAGESWNRGPIVLAWDVLVREGRVRHCPSSLVIHEFAHHLDGLDGEMGGTPPMPRREASRWDEVVGREYDSLVASVQQGVPTLLDPYGASNRAEFFAVASECFYRRPSEMQQRHPELYHLLRAFYRVEPGMLEAATTYQ